MCVGVANQFFPSSHRHLSDGLEFCSFGAVPCSDRHTALNCLQEPREFRYIKGFRQFTLGNGLFQARHEHSKRSTSRGPHQVVKLGMAIASDGAGIQGS